MRFSLPALLAPIHGNRRSRPRGRGGYTFLPHDSVQAQLRRCRQAARYQLPASQFASGADYLQARHFYHAAVAQAKRAKQAA